MSDTLPGLEVEEVEPAPVLSAGARRTARQHADIERGVHPATGSRLLPIVDGEKPKTCGDCEFLIGKRYDTTYWKCEKALTDGRGPDIRTRWPACTQFQEREDDERTVVAMP